jgi:hypothetical protein
MHMRIFTPIAVGARLPTCLRVHLVPAEPASADDALRYAETAVMSDGRFGMGYCAGAELCVALRIAMITAAPGSYCRRGSILAVDLGFSLSNLL